MKQIISICSVLFFFGYTYAQELKIEEESRIKSDLVPEKAFNWVQEAFPSSPKTKWFREVASPTNSNEIQHISFEAKLKFHGSVYSIEFSESGDLEDVEITKKLHDLPETHRKTLKQAFDKYPKFRLQKLQEQWTGESSEVQNAVVTGKTEKVITRYEVEFEGDVDAIHAYWEALFETDGALIQIRQIYLRPSDNMDL